MTRWSMRTKKLLRSWKLHVLLGRCRAGKNGRCGPHPILATQVPVVQDLYPKRYVDPPLQKGMQGCRSSLIAPWKAGRAIAAHAVHAWVQRGVTSVGVNENCNMQHGAPGKAFSWLLGAGLELDGMWVQMVQQQMEDTMRAQDEMTRRLAALEHRPGIPAPEQTACQVRMSRCLQMTRFDRVIAVIEHIHALST